MTIQLLPTAESEIADGMDYYNEVQSGLGYEFALEVKKGLLRISSFPNAWPIFQDSIRITHLKRFPYAILYEVQTNVLVVFAVMHLKQNPKTWEKHLETYLKR